MRTIPHPRGQKLGAAQPQGYSYTKTRCPSKAGRGNSTGMDYMATKICIPLEVAAGETRVAAVPQTVRGLVSAGLEVCVQAGAGAKAFFDDASYESAGARIVPDAASLLSEASVVLKVRPPQEGEIPLIGRGATLICPLQATSNLELVRALSEGGITSFALDAVPRIARAQSMDVLSSMSSLAGYKAVLLAAEALSKIVPMMMTAAGTIRAAGALIIGAGVAGLQAIATARRLGAVVKAVDVRPAVREQVESLGAKFVSMEVAHEAPETAGGYAKDLGEEFYKQEQGIIAPHLKDCDFVISTALIPGRPAPILITEQMVGSMPKGSVIVDLAAEAGGNCSLTEPGRTIECNGVKIIGPTNLPARMPVHASLMFARNAAAFLKELLADGQLVIDMENQVIRETLITRDGRIVHAPTLEAIEARKEQP